MDFILTLDDSATPGSGALFDFGMNFLTSVAFDFGPNSLSGQIALSDLGGDDGLVNFTTTIGTGPQPTDATDSVGTSTAIPEPSAVGLIVSAGLLGMRRRRR